MKRRTYVTILGGATFSLAGCTVDSESPTNNGFTPTSPTKTPPTDMTVYGDPSETGQQLFRRMLERESITVPRSEIPLGLSQTEYMEHRGAVYTLRRNQTGHCVSEYVLATSAVERSAIDDESDMIAFEELFQTTRDVFKTAHERE